MRSKYIQNSRTVCIYKYSVARITDILWYQNLSLFIHGGEYVCSSHLHSIHVLFFCASDDKIHIYTCIFSNRCKMSVKIIICMLGRTKLLSGILTPLSLSFSLMSSLSFFCLLFKYKICCLVVLF